MSHLRDLLSRLKGSERARDLASRAFLVIFASLFVLQLLIPLIETWREESTWAIRLTTTALVTTFIAVYSYTIFRMYFLRRSWIQIFTQRERWILRGLTGGTASVLVWWQGEEWAPALIFVVLVAILTGSAPKAFITQTTALVFVVGVLVSAHVSNEMLLTILAFSFVFGTMIAAQLRQGGVIGELIESRYTGVRIAAAEERLRLAQDLHDVLGRNLSLITLKSELAHRLITMDPDRAEKEIRDVEVLARSAMSDVRGTVSRERRPILIVEIEDARQILDAAGIEFVVKGERISFTEEIETLFAWAVREGVTNVVRHSRASCCTINLAHLGDRALLTIEDDGSGNGAPGEGRGSGIAGLRERAEAIHGSLAFELLLDSSGHRLTMEVPTPSLHQGH